MVDLVLRPSALVPGKPWAMQLRWHESVGETEYATLARVGEHTAREIIRAGAPFWLFGDPGDAPPPGADTMETWGRARPMTREDIGL